MKNYLLKLFPRLTKFFSVEKEVSLNLLGFWVSHSKTMIQQLVLSINLPKNSFKFSDSAILLFF